MNGNQWARLLAYVTGLVNQELLLQNELWFCCKPVHGELESCQNTVVWEVLRHLLTLAAPHVKSCCNRRFVIVFGANLQFATDRSEMTVRFPRLARYTTN